MKNKPYFLILCFWFYSSFSYSANQAPRALTSLPAQGLFQFVFNQLGPIYDLCLEDTSCSLNEKEKLLLKSIRTTLDQEQKTALRFESGQKNPELFFLDGNIRIAVTGSNIGDPIYINLDLASTKDSRGDLQSVKLDRVIAILTHELGHHHSWKNHTELDLMGLKVAAHFLAQVEWLDIAGNNNQDPDHRPLNLYMASFNFPFTETTSRQTLTKIWLFDEYRATEFTESIFKQNLCPVSEQSYPAEQVRFFNWEAIGWDFAADSDLYKCPNNSSYVGGSFFVLGANMQMHCKDFYPQAQLKLQIYFRRSCDRELPLNPYNHTLFLFQKIRKLQISL